MSFQTVYDDSPFFTLYQLDAHIFAAIEKDEALTGSNGGFIDLGNEVLIVDAFLNPDAAKSLKETAEQITNKPVKKVALTHRHLDHVGGFQHFKDCDIISSDRTRNEMKLLTKNEIDNIKKTSEEKIADMQKEMKETTDEQTKKDIANDLKFINIVKQPEFEVPWPNITIQKQFTIYTEDFRVVFDVHPKAHMDGDLTVYIPEKKIIFMGDLLFANRDPWMGHGDPEGYILTLENIKYWDIDIAVPGHGKLAGKTEIQLQIDYMKAIIKLIHDNLDTDNKLTKSLLPEPFKSWESAVFEWNVNSLKEIIAKKE